jgi:hypothetical protein
MDWVWFLFAFDGRINRAKAWLAVLVILCWMLFIAAVMLGIDGLFGNPVKSVHFNINDIFAFVDPAVLRAAIARLREGKEACLPPTSFSHSSTPPGRCCLPGFTSRPPSSGCMIVTRVAGGSFRFSRSRVSTPSSWIGSTTPT